jgi:uncharacterized protein
LSRVYVDADACPVKDETYRVARRHRLPVTLVSNSWMRTPLKDGIELVVVEGGLDVADDWIAERAGAGDVVITADIPLASRSLEKGAQVLSPTGRLFTHDMIGDALATREIHAHLREIGSIGGGPPPFGKKDRSRFLEVLEEAIRQAKKL